MNEDKIIKLLEQALDNRLQPILEILKDHSKALHGLDEAVQGIKSVQNVQTEILKDHSTALHGLDEVVQGIKSVQNVQTEILKDHSTALHGLNSVARDIKAVQDIHTEMLKHHTNILNQHTQQLTAIENFMQLQVGHSENISERVRELERA